ncbi:MAG: response regulator [Candidatus Nanopelagicales bacterium]|jgi:DNA-binding response OmpR family regulator|nr:response regulator [Actinomycetota bacterium]HNE89180.1 response regulator [Actinomycetota bacterium]HNL51773.1 response regulator [Actinomycetota bacterium]HNO15731.1 response regulator [Actinomycetota bacterium]
MATVLIVDDEPSVRDLIRDTLELEDHVVNEAVDGPSALEALRADQLPDLVVLDIMMPGMSGLDVLTELRGQPTTKELPVILLTAMSDDATTWAGWSAGANVFLPKPFDPGALLDWIDRVLEGGGEMEPTL